MVLCSETIVWLWLWENCTWFYISISDFIGVWTEDCYLPSEFLLKTDDENVTQSLKERQGVASIARNFAHYNEELLSLKRKEKKLSHYYVLLWREGCRWEYAVYWRNGYIVQPKTVHSCDYRGLFSRWNNDPDGHCCRCTTRRIGSVKASNSKGQTDLFFFFTSSSQPRTFQNP